jgi:hypothetical protein
VEEYLTEYELLLLRKDEYEAAYEFTRKYKLFQH